MATDAHEIRDPIHNFIHPKDYIRAYRTQSFGEPRFPIEPEKRLELMDEGILRELWRDAFRKGVDPHARRLVRREHFRLLHQRHPSDPLATRQPGRAVFEALSHEFAAERFRRDHYVQRSRQWRFPVRARDGRISSAGEHSEVLRNIPRSSVDFAFADRQGYREAESWLRDRRTDITATSGEG